MVFHCCNTGPQKYKSWSRNFKLKFNILTNVFLIKFYVKYIVQVYNFFRGDLYLRMRIRSWNVMFFVGWFCWLRRDVTNIYFGNIEKIIPSKNKVGKPQQTNNPRIWSQYRRSTPTFLFEKGIFLLESFKRVKTNQLYNRVWSLKGWVSYLLVLIAVKNQTVLTVRQSVRDKPPISIKPSLCRDSSYLDLLAEISLSKKQIQLVLLMADFNKRRETGGGFSHPTFCT